MLLSVNELRKLVRCYDPAIDYVKIKIQEYWQRRQYENLVFRAGMLPVVFEARLLDDEALRSIVAASTDNEVRAELAFRFGIVRVTNLHTRTGARTTWESHTKNHPGGSQAAILDADASQFSWDDRVEIGSVVLYSSRLPFDLRSEVSLPLPPTSGRILSLMLSRAAERTLDDALQSSANAKDPLPEADPMLQSLGSLSDAPTDATASPMPAT